MRTLKEIAESTQTDKLTAHSYIPVYERFLQPMRQEPIRLLEIGVLRGASIHMWLEYFPNAQVVGMDIEPRHVLTHERYNQIHCSQSDINRVPTLFPFDHFDVIIDDGSHFAEDNILTLHMLWPALKPNGLYFIEDLQHGPPHWRNSVLYWKQHCPYIYKCREHEVFDTSQQTGRFDDILVVLRKQQGKI